MKDWQTDLLDLMTLSKLSTPLRMEHHPCHSDLKSKKYTLFNDSMIYISKDYQFKIFH